jgi:hypothetical protein
MFSPLNASKDVLADFAASTNGVHKMGVCFSQKEFLCLHVALSHDLILPTDSLLPAQTEFGFFQIVSCPLSHAPTTLFFPCNHQTSIMAVVYGNGEGVIVGADSRTTTGALSDSFRSTSPFFSCWISSLSRHHIFPFLPFS